MKRTILAACAVLMVVATGTAHAQYPNKPIRLIVPFAPGGSSDIVSRSFAVEMIRMLGQSVVESKPGGAGIIAMQEVKGAAPDGYTIILGHVGTLAVNPAMFAKLPYDPVKDFVPITLLAKVPSLLVVNSEKMNVKNLKELVGYEENAGRTELWLCRQWQLGPPRDGVHRVDSGLYRNTRAIQRHRPDDDGSARWPA